MNWSNTRVLTLVLMIQRTRLSYKSQFDTDLFRFSYSSLTTPNSVYDYNLVSKERTLLNNKKFWVAHLI